MTGDCRHRGGKEEEVEVLGVKFSHDLLVQCRV
jgi:hypothetical protein